MTFEQRTLFDTHNMVIFIIRQLHPTAADTLETA